MRFFIALLFCLHLSAPALAEEATITMSGQGAVSVAPDIAQISVGVTTQAPTADRALRANSAAMRKVFELLEAEHIASKDIQTVQFSVHPQWSNQQKSYDKPLEIDGFVATNIVRVKVRDIPALGAVLDALTKAGANRIESISFSIAEPAPYLDEARKRAVADARHKAKIFAEAAGRALGEIEVISESVNAANPMFRAEALRMDATPIAEGQQIVSAEVTIRWTLQ